MILFKKVSGDGYGGNGPDNPSSREVVKVKKDLVLSTDARMFLREAEPHLYNAGIDKRREMNLDETIKTCAHLISTNFYKREGFLTNVLAQELEKVIRKRLEEESDNIRK
jgi:hypothetical protein